MLTLQNTAACLFAWVVLQVEFGWFGLWDGGFLWDFSIFKKIFLQTLDELI